MALDTAKEWEADADSWMVDKLRTDTPPDMLADCRRDQQWSPMYHLYAEKNYASENIEFLDAVDAFRGSPNADVASKIYNDYVRSGALNLFARDGLDQIFEQEVLLTSQDMFDEAFDEIYNLTNQDSYGKFKDRASKIKRELEAAAAEDSDHEEPAEREVEIGSPQKVEMSRDRVDMAVVDAMNEQSLKDLDEGFSTGFWQLGDLVIIAWTGPTDDQPYVPWIRSQVECSGIITMKKKGGAFSPGTLTVTNQGLSDRRLFEAALARVTKKKIEYA